MNTRQIVEVERFDEMLAYPSGTIFRHRGGIWRSARGRNGKMEVIRMSKVGGGLRKGEERYLEEDLK